MSAFNRSKRGPWDHDSVWWVEYDDLSGDTLGVEIWGSAPGAPVVALNVHRTSDPSKVRTVCVKLEDMPELIAELLEATLRARSMAGLSPDP